VSRSAKIIIGIAVAALALVAGSILALGLLGGGDGPEELSFEDAPTTTAATGGSDPADVPSASTDSLDGAWVVAGGSQAGYRVLEDRIGGLQNIEAVGRTDAVSGGFTVAGTTVRSWTRRPSRRPRSPPRRRRSPRSPPTARPSRFRSAVS
jgi:hypothetical protein